MTTLDRDTAAFLTAIARNPADTDTQLVFADWLDEQPNQYLCKRDFPGVHLDHDLRDRAEYIRAAVELGRTRDGADPKRGLLWNPAAQRYISVKTHEMTEREKLLSRQATLRAANPRWTSLPCPVCWGTGNEDAQKIPNDPLTCRTCGGSGDLFYIATPEPVMAPRIDPARDFYGAGNVPWVQWVGCRMEEVGWEQRVRCKKCHGEGDARYTCGGCDGSGTIATFVPSLWAAAVAAHCPSVRGFRVTDRKAYWNGGGYCWFDASRDNPDNRIPAEAQLLSVVFAAIEGWKGDKTKGYRWKPFDTELAATDALAVAMMTLVRGGQP